ncbi:FAD-dependent oxidoreductase [Pseudolysinimonas yzui]|uniref:FAD-dependent oxidoreductase n=1 Tax=Pseudolysinimonas yzui TaxID=2708254 RepID=A0A8J3GR93_9MICO|nr:NAD(P)/FAD-dependent oxidoreductase [Pseudolysinimonas yzui]GHF18924.1 FAD-dependent oxidoreductase [Pseudolysinimonas yzui]
MTDPIAVLGCGPAGMATALALHTVGHEVRIYERYPEARPAGIILNLWPPPIRALEEMGVDTVDLGAPCHTTFRNAYTGHVRAETHLPDDVIARYQGGFIGMLRPVLYERMLGAMPDGIIQVNRTVTGIRDHGDGVQLTFADGSTVQTPVLIGADGIDSVVRTHLWGASPKREHRLQVIGGYTTEMPESAERNEAVIAHTRRVQGSYSAIRDHGRDGYQWWVLEAWDPEKPAPTDLHAHASELARDFGAALTDLIAATKHENTQRWAIRDRKPLTRWSRGRVTLAGDAAHATSPYAAYGAGMAIGDGYTLAKLLKHVDLASTPAVEEALLEYDRRRIPHTTSQVQQAYILGKAFHHIPRPLRPLRDFMLDRTDMLQKQVGDRSPQEIVDQLQEMGAETLANA